MTGDILVLYLGVSNFAISDVHFKEVHKIEKPNYYVSKTLQLAEARCPQFGRLTFTFVIVAKKCELYFLAPKIRIYTNQPLKQSFKSQEKTPWMAKYSRHIGTHHDKFMPRISIKRQV